MVISCLTFEEAVELFSKVVVLFYITSATYEGSGFSVSSPTLLIIAFLVDVLWNLIVVLICIFHMTDEIEHFFLSLLAICIYSLVKFIYFAHFLNRVV